MSNVPGISMKAEDCDGSCLGSVGWPNEEGAQGFAIGSRYLQFFVVLNIKLRWPRHFCSRARRQIPGIDNLAASPSARTSLSWRGEACLGTSSLLKVVEGSAAQAHSSSAQVEGKAEPRQEACHGRGSGRGMSGEMASGGGEAWDC